MVKPILAISLASVIPLSAAPKNESSVPLAAKGVQPAPDFAAIQSQLAATLTAPDRIGPDLRKPMDERYLLALAQHELIRTVGAEKLKEAGNAGKDPQFLKRLTADRAWLEWLLASGPLGKDPAVAIRVLASLTAQDPSIYSDPQARATATAIALVWSFGQWPEDKAWKRYLYFRDSLRADLLHPSFARLAVWERRFVVNVNNNGGYSAEWENEALVWLRENVHLPAKDYTGACWQAPYLGENAFGDSVHGDRYYMPFTHLNYAERIRKVGGVCGSLSHYGANAARANGIPATTMGEPGHCAYAVRVDGNWKPAYSLSWKRGLHSGFWERTWSSFVLADAVYADKTANSKAQRYLWLAEVLANTTPDLTNQAYLLATESQPLNYGIWCDYADWLKNVRKPDKAAWLDFTARAAKALAKYPEVAGELLRRVDDAVLASGLSDGERTAYLLGLHRAMVQEKGPETWDFEALLSRQVDLLKGGAESKLAFYKELLGIHAASPHYFAPLIAWGQERFGKGEQSAAYFATLSAVFAEKGDQIGKDAFRKVIATASLAAANSDNVEAFQAIGQIGKTLYSRRADEGPAFPGDLLSSGGLLRVSSTSGYDHPEQHWGVVENYGGSFHTANEKQPRAEVRLAKLGELNGVKVVVDGNQQNLHRHFPMRISISEDGKEWTPVTTITKATFTVSVDLTSSHPKAQWVRVERDDDRSEPFHLAKINVYGRRLQ